MILNENYIQRLSGVSNYEVFLLNNGTAIGKVTPFIFVPVSSLSVALLDKQDEDTVRELIKHGRAVSACAFITAKSIIYSTD